LVFGTHDCTSGGREQVTLTVTASEPSPGKYAFDLPSTIAGGVVKLTVENTAQAAHDLQLVRVKDGTAQGTVVDGLLDAPDGAPLPDFLLGASGAGRITPGQTTTITEEFDPGTYVYFCTLGDGDGLHYKNGMLGTVIVTGDTAKGGLPKADATVRAKEYGFEISGLKAGSNPVTFENTGAEFHHAVFVPLGAGAMFDDAVTAFQADAPPPVDFDRAAGFAVTSPGGTALAADLVLDHGTYVVICSLRDRAGGAPHFTKGMIQELDIP
jgi:plastocyanin